MIKRKKGIGFTILLSLPPVPPALSLTELVEELYGQNDRAFYSMILTVKNLIDAGWKITQHKYGYFILDREHRDLLLRYCRASRPKKPDPTTWEPEWPKGIKLTPKNVEYETEKLEKYRKNVKI